jgi:hypothetical protein
MTRTLHCATVSIFAFTLLCLGCQKTAPVEPANGEAPAVEERGTASTASEVTYEPAYPTEVSEEGLDEEDVTQQTTTHSHGGAEHSHGDGEHSHEDEEHAHDEGEHAHDEEATHDDHRHDP